MGKIQEILNRGWKEYNKNHKVVGYKKKTVTAIADCKTGRIGAHKYVCDECGYEEIAYNSCRNRHCPNCQAGKKLQWIEARKSEVLNIKYYHVVYTIPDELNLITLQNQSKIYKILFKTSAETLQELAEDKKYLGGEIGFFSILHTWGQKMMYHPHVHIVTTGGGLTELNKWAEKEEDFFIPVKVMSKVFRGKFLYYLKQEKLDFYGKNKYIENPASFNSLIQSLYVFGDTSQMQKQDIVNNCDIQMRKLIYWGLSEMVSFFLQFGTGYFLANFHDEKMQEYFLHFIFSYSKIFIEKWR